MKTSSTSTKTEPELKLKPNSQVEAIGLPVMQDLGTPTIMPFSPSNDNSDQKNYTNGKNATKPR